MWCRRLNGHHKLPYWKEAPIATPALQALQGANESSGWLQHVVHGEAFGAGHWQI